MRMRLTMQRAVTRDQYFIAISCGDCGHHQTSNVDYRTFLVGEYIVPIQPCRCVGDSPFGPGYRDALNNPDNAGRIRIQPDPPPAQPIRAALERVPTRVVPRGHNEVPDEPPPAADDRPDATVRFSLLELK